MSRGKFAWILIGIFVFISGIAFGLEASWGLFPARLENTAPGTFSPADKDFYKMLVADDFWVNSDVARAQTRLSLLEEHDVHEPLKDLINRVELQGDPNHKLDALQALSDALRENDRAIISRAIPQSSSIQTTSLHPTPQNNDPVEVPGQTPSLLPNISTSTAQVYNRKPVCSGDQDFASAQIFVIDASGQPISGIVLIVESEDSLQRLVTGLDPEIGPGYVDFILEPGMVYTLTLVGDMGISEQIKANECTNQDGKLFPGGWLIEIHL